jgi:cytoskeletal protein RodZ
MIEAGQPVRTRRLELETQRLRRGISLEAVTEKTKIGVHFLQAIEAEQFDRLPGGVFATSYIRQYAATTGVDAGEILARYAEFLNSITPAHMPPRGGVALLQEFLSRVLIPRRRNTSGPENGEPAQRASST